jgi:hypothetical protein
MQHPDSSYVRIYGAGHEVPAYQNGTLAVGEAAFQIFSQTMNNQSVTSTGPKGDKSTTTTTTTDPNESTTATATTRPSGARLSCTLPAGITYLYLLIFLVIVLTN